MPVRVGTVSNYDDAMGFLADKFGEKDNLISLSTIALSPGENGEARPSARLVDAFYSDGCFYTVTNAQSLKMQQIAKNPAVAICYIVENFTAEGTGENLGWVREPQNQELAAKLRDIFAEWYHLANNDDNPDTCILKIQLTNGLWNDAHAGTRNEIDFIAQTAT